MSDATINPPPDDASLLRWLTERCAANFAGDQKAQAYLRDNDVADELHFTRGMKMRQVCASV